MREKELAGGEWRMQLEHNDTRRKTQSIESVKESQGETRVSLSDVGVASSGGEDADNDGAKLGVNCLGVRVSTFVVCH